MTATLRARAALLLATIALAACATNYRLVTSAPQTVADALSVTPRLQWNRVNAPPWEGRVELWTFDGPALDGLLFIAGAADGEPLFRSKPAALGVQDAPPPFRREMTMLEIAELFQATLVRNFETPIVAVTRLKPATFGGVPGFRFETRLTGRDEVERSGTAVGAVRNGRLYLLWFQGARIRFYDRYLPEFDAIVASVRFVD